MNYCCKTNLGSFHVKQIQIHVIWSLPGEPLTLFCPDTYKCIFFSSFAFKNPSGVQWPKQALCRWGRLLREALSDLWVQTEMEGLCNLNRIVSMTLWIEFLQSWCKIRGHAQSCARWLGGLWLNGDKVKWQLQHKEKFAIHTGRPLRGYKYAALLNCRWTRFVSPFENKKSKLLGRNRRNTSAYHCFLRLRLEQSWLAAHANRRERDLDEVREGGTEGEKEGETQAHKWALRSQSVCPQKTVSFTISHSLTWSSSIYLKVQYNFLLTC